MAYVEIPLTKGYTTLVDCSDAAELIKDNKWVTSAQGYAYRFSHKSEGYKVQLMHRYITKAAQGYDVDHINGNKLDNRRSNLRIATRTLNNYNRPNVKGIETSKYWSGAVVRVHHNYQRYYIGRFADFDEALHVRNAVMEQLIEMSDTMREQTVNNQENN